VQRLKRARHKDRLCTDASDRMTEHIRNADYRGYPRVPAATSRQRASIVMIRRDGAVDQAGSWKAAPSGAFAVLPVVDQIIDHGWIGER